MLILFVVLLLLVLGSTTYYIYFISSMKSNSSLLREQIDKLAAKYREEGLDKYYAGLSTKELVREHKEILDAYERYIDDIEKSADLCCRENLI